MYDEFDYCECDERSSMKSWNEMSKFSKTFHIAVAAVFLGTVIGLLATWFWLAIANIRRYQIVDVVLDGLLRFAIAVIAIAVYCYCLHCVFLCINVWKTKRNVRKKV